MRSPNLASLFSRGLQRVRGQENLFPIAPILSLPPAHGEGKRQSRITHQPPAIHTLVPLSLSWDFKKKTPKPAVLLSFGFASLLGISHILFSGGYFSCLWPVLRGDIPKMSQEQDRHFGLFRWGFQGIVLGRHFVHRCLKQAFCNVSSWSLAYQVRALTPSVSATMLVSTPISADSPEGLCKASQSLLWWFCQRNDRQPFWEERSFRLRLAIHQAWGICLILPVIGDLIGHLFTSGCTFPCYTSCHSSSTFLSPILTSGDIILLQPHLTIAIPVWLNNFQQRAEKYSSESQGLVGSLNHSKSELPGILRLPCVTPHFPMDNWGTKRWTDFPKILQQVVPLSGTGGTEIYKHQRDRGILRTMKDNFKF